VIAAALGAAAINDQHKAGQLGERRREDRMTLATG